MSRVSDDAANQIHEGEVELRQSRVRPRTREIWVRGTFFGRVWATLTETILHPFTKTILRFQRPVRPDDIDAEFSR